MKRVLVAKLPRQGTSSVLDEKEAHHIVKVLRLRDGESVEAMDGNGASVQAVLRLKGGAPRLEFDSASAARVESQNTVLPITLEIAVLKGDAMEWVVEKAVELGVERLSPIMTAHTVVQLKNKGPDAFRERWQKIADQALKQCGRLQRMEVSLPVELEVLLSQRTEHSSLRAWCDEAVKDGDFIGNLAPPSPETRLHLMIGPEGGWSAVERELLSRPQAIDTHRVSLGPLILRAETAAIFGISVWASHFRRSRA